MVPARAGAHSAARASLAAAQHLSRPARSVRRGALRRRACGAMRWRRLARWRQVVVVNADDPLVADLWAPTLIVRHGRARTVGTDSLCRTPPTHACARAAALPLRVRRGLLRASSAITDARLLRLSRGPCRALRRRLVVSFFGDAGTNLTVQTRRWGYDPRPTLRLPGLYNVYNALGGDRGVHGRSVSRATSLARGLETFTAAFGRLERIQVEDRQLFLALVKNPVGFTEVLRVHRARTTSAGRSLLIAINDLLRRTASTCRGCGTSSSSAWRAVCVLSRCAPGCGRTIWLCGSSTLAVESERIRVEHDLQPGDWSLALAASRAARDRVRCVDLYGHDRAMREHTSADCATCAASGRTTVVAGLRCVWCTCIPT